jgi:hypothetical protein
MSYCDRRLHRYRGTQGRHSTDNEPTTQVNVRLPESLIAVARANGNGDISAGVRNALRSLGATPETVTSHKIIEH